MAKFNLLSFFKKAHTAGEAEKAEFTRSYFIEFALKGCIHSYDLPNELAHICFVAAKARANDPVNAYQAYASIMSDYEIHSIPKIASNKKCKLTY